MALATKLPDYITPEEYLALEEQAEEKSEYFDGVVTLMAGGSANHNGVRYSVGIELGAGLRGTSCQPFDSETRLLIESNGLYTYPDEMVVCGEVKRTAASTETITNPTLIIEVLSPSTESYDRGLKFERYRTIESFREYVLIHQDRPFIEHYRKGEDGVWLTRFIQGLDATLSLETIDFELPLDRIYERVDWLDSGGRQK